MNPGDPRTRARRTLDAAISEAQFQQDIIDTARTLGWLAYHPYDSRKSEEGFPDLVLVHPIDKVLIFAELKTERGRVSRAQQRWLDALEFLSDWFSDDYCAAFVRVWRPRDRDEIDRYLRREY